MLSTLVIVLEES